MVCYGSTNCGSVCVSFRHGIVLGLWRELVRFYGMCVKLKDKIVLQGCIQGHCEYGLATGISPNVFGSTQDEFRIKPFCW